MVLNIYKGAEDVDKTKKEEEEADLKEEVVTTSTGQPVNRMKQINRPDTLTVGIQNSGLINQNLNAIIVKT
jgi:hypothetical protein